MHDTSDRVVCVLVCFFIFLQPGILNLDAVGEYKMVLVVRQDLGMGKGKVAAQVGKQQYNIAVHFLYILSAYPY